MVEFCKECGAMMLPAEKNGKKVLECNSCGSTKLLSDEITNSYVFTTKIDHPKGTEFKNTLEIKKWKKKLKERRKFLSKRQK
jgi:DNA-directed RNA polymerase subunit M/transcription elongation factor TFIIS